MGLVRIVVGVVVVALVGCPASTDEPDGTSSPDAATEVSGETVASDAVADVDDAVEASPDVTDADVDDAGETSPDVTDAVGDDGDDGDAETDADDAQVDASDIALGDVDDDAAGDASDGADTSSSAGLACPLEASGDALFDLGHATTIVGLERAGERVASLDKGGGWILWDTATGQRLARGDDPACPPRSFEPCTTSLTIGLAASTMLVRSPSELLVLDARDGSESARIATSSATAGVARDGGVVWAASESALGVWGTDGTPLVALAGDYRAASVLADADGLWIAAGPRGATVIEHWAPGAEATTLSAPFAGTFHSWFLTGERFVTAVGNNVRVYAKDATPVTPLWTLPRVAGLRGHGDTLSTCCPLEAFALGASEPFFTSTPSEYYRFVGASHRFVAVAAQSQDRFHIVELAGGVATVSDVPLRVTMFAADADGAWVTDRGMRHADAPGAAPGPALGCGTALSMDGNEDGRLVVSTTSGRTMVVDIAADGARILVAELASSSAEELKISAAGDRVVWRTDAAAQRDETIEIRELPSGALLRSLPVVDDAAQTIVQRFVLAEAGARLGLVVCGFVGGCRAVVTDLMGTMTSLDVPTQILSPLALSRDGARVAVGDGGTDWDATTSIYEDGELVGAAEGYPAVWLDAERLLVVRCFVGRLGSNNCTTTNTVDTTGAVLGSMPAGISEAAQLAPPDWIYDAYSNALFALDDGAREWIEPGRGTVVRRAIAFRADHRVYLDPY
ncbi:MAG: hypothetical protein IT385_19190 [Deltaproteobacteria bacterium]|nr:hypothetical protein [Deltaproteobacteria bacterium]